MNIQSAPLREIEASVLYRILALRTDVFVVEQHCAYAELDGRDLEPATRLVWAQRDGEVAATLRVLAEPDGSARIGRVATALAHRGRGIAGQLMRHAIVANSEREIVLHAQAQLESWYARFGFARNGPQFLEDDIPHIPMRRAVESSIRSKS
jgi:ElaA protein